jgi:hypothetical protein
LKSQEAFLQILESDTPEAKLGGELQGVFDKLFHLDNLDVSVTGDFGPFSSGAIAKPWKPVIKKMKLTIKAGRQSKSK